MYMEITISEFRKNIKGYFDSALRDEVVCIERGGVHYNLTARLPRGLAVGENIKENHDGTISKIDSTKPASFATDLIPLAPAKDKHPTTIIKSIDRLSNGICKIHGTPLDSRGKCLQKGCKYA